MQNSDIAVLYATKKSIYKTLGCDVYDLERNARNFTGGKPVIVHPPCGQWSKLKGLANKNFDNKRLAGHAIRMVHENGGILEHPLGSDLFKKYLPLPGENSKLPGKSYLIWQSWFGHKAKKPTLLYSTYDLEPFPLKFDAIEYVMGIREVGKAYRLNTPIELAQFLINKIKQYETISHIL